MIVALFVISLVNLLGLILLAFEQRRVSDLYEQMLRVLSAERDTLKTENLTLKTALFPQLSRVVGAASNPQQRSGLAPTPSAAPAPTSFPSRKPWRIQMKELMRRNNTQQIGRDRMAAAISSQEKSNG